MYEIWSKVNELVQNGKWRHKKKSWRQLVHCPCIAGEADKLGESSLAQSSNLRAITQANMRKRREKRSWEQGSPVAWGPNAPLVIPARAWIVLGDILTTLDHINFPWNARWMDYTILLEARTCREQRRIDSITSFYSSSYFSCWLWILVLLFYILLWASNFLI